MMGTKIHSFSPLPHDLSLEDLVPQDHFYRRLQARLDLSVVRELVAPGRSRRRSRGLRPRASGQARKKGRLALQGRRARPPHRARRLPQEE